MTVDLATPPHETAGGRKKLAAKGQTAYGTSYPVPNVSYLKKALKAVGRVKPGKRATLGRFLRKRARELGATSVIKGSWADNTAGAKAMAQALEDALELARADGTLWELNHVVELVGPKGYIHGWIKVSGPMGHKAKVGQHVRVQRTAGPAYGQVISRKTGGGIDIRTRKGERLGSHEGMVTHVYQGEGPPKGGIKAPLKERAARAAAPSPQTDEGGKGSGGEAAIKKAEKLAPGEQRPLRIAGKRMTKGQSAQFHSLSPSGQDAYEEHRQEGGSHADAMAHGRKADAAPKSKERGTAAERADARKRLGTQAAYDAYQSRRFHGYGHEESVKAGLPAKRSPQYGRLPSDRMTPERKAQRKADRVARGETVAQQNARQQAEVDALPESAKGAYSKAHTLQGKSHDEAMAAARAKGTAAKRMATTEGKRAAARVAPAIHAHAAAKEPVTSHTAHAELLKARTAARKAYPQGHPERLKAERAVRASRKTRRAGAGGGGGTTKAAGAPSTSRRRRTPVAVGATSAPSSGKSIEQRQAEVAGLSPAARRTYAQAKLKGIGHERAMGVAKARPKPPKGTAAAKRRRMTGEGKAPSKSTTTHAAALSAARAESVSPGSSALASRLGATAVQVSQIRQLAKALEGRGWSTSEARKLAIGRILRGEKVPQYAPGRKGPRQR